MQILEKIKKYQNRRKQGFSLFLPVYNEEKNILSNVPRIHEEMRRVEKRFEIIIVDDNSRDSTADSAKQVMKKLKNVRYIKYNNGPSRRENIGIAFREAKYDIVGFMDIDLATDISYLRQLYFSVRNGADVATGSRYKGIKPERTLFRRLISFAYNLFMLFYFNSRIQDHQCGFKAFKKEKILEILREMKYDRKFRRGWFWDAEVLIRAQKKKLKVAEFPVKWVFGKKSTFNIKRELKMIPYVIMLRLRI